MNNQEANHAPPKRLWFRWSLRAMFIATTVIACWIGWNVNLVKKREAAYQRINNTPGARIMLAPAIVPYASWNVMLFGGRGVLAIKLPDGFSGEEYAGIKGLFPEANIR